MNEELLKTSLSRPWMFFCDCRTVTNVRRTINVPFVSRFQRRIPSFTGSFFLGTPLVSKQVVTALKIAHCKHGSPPPTDAGHISSDEYNFPQPEVRLYQSWRSPTWLHHSQLRSTRISTTEPTSRYQPFKDIRDAMFRFACMGLVLAGLGGLHYLYQVVNRLARAQVQVASTALDIDISIGRLARCNPVTGVRIKKVSVSRPSSQGSAPFASASYVDASVSGYLGLILRRRPLELSVDMEQAAVTVSNIVAKEYDRDKVEAPNLEQPIRILAGAWRQSAMWTNLAFPKLLEPSSISFRRSQLRLESTQQSLVRKSVNTIEMINMSGRLDLAQYVQPAISHPSRGRNVRNTVSMKGNFRGGGSVRIAVNPTWNRGSSTKASVPSVNATLSCTKVSMGSIASFLSLPFKLLDGHCSGNVELELSPHVNPIPTMRGQAEVKSLGLRFDPSPESPELRNLTGRVRFKERSLVLDNVEGDLGTIPLEAEGRIDFVEGFNIVSHARPFDVNKVIETFALDRFIPIEGSVIGKAVVRGALDEPFVSGWIKAVGNRARADKVLLKSAEMIYEWDTAAGNLLFPSIRAKVVGGGEITGSGGVYFDMTQETPYGCWSEQHHARNPKAQYWNSDVSVEKSVPQLPRDDFEVDRWAPFRPYDSMEFKIRGSGVSGENLLHWYGREFGAMATEAIGRICGFCYISGHVDDANSRLVWRSTREGSLSESQDKHTLTVPSSRASTSDQHTARKSSTMASSVPGSEQESPWKDNGVEYLGGLVYMKLGDLPEARRVKVRTVVKEFHVKRLFTRDPVLRKLLLRAPNAVSSADTLFKGIVCMRPSWEGVQSRSSRARAPLDLVSIEGALAVRKLTVNGVAFRNVISGSLSLSATDISLSLMEHNPQGTSVTGPKTSLASVDHKNKIPGLRRSLDKLEVNVNAKGFLNMFMKWESSEVRASVAMDDKMRRVARLDAKSLDLQQLSGEYNPLYEGEAAQGIINASANLDLTNQTGLVNMTATDLALGPLHFGLAKGQLVLKEGEVSLQEATLEQRLSKYKLDGKYMFQGDVSDFECFVNVNIDRAHIRDLARLFEGGKAIIESMPQQRVTEEQLLQSTSRSASWGFQSENQFANRDSSITYWEVPEELPFSEQAKWYSESLKKQSDADLLSILDSGVTRTDTPLRMYHTDNHLSGRVSMHYTSRKHRDKQKLSTVSGPDRSPLHMFGNTSLSFNLAGRNWILGSNKIELMTASGFLEDGSLSVGPFQIKGKDGLLADAECRISNAGSVYGSVNLRNVPVSNFDIFQKAGFNASGDITGKFGIKGTISNPSAYGQMLWQNATVNERRVSQPHADLACSNGRCVINVDAEVGGKGRQRNVDNEKVEEYVATNPMYGALRDVEIFNGKTRVKSVSAKRRKDIDTVRAQVSIPVKLFLHQYVLPRIPQGILPDHLDAVENRVPFDDDWIYASVDVKRYGMVLLNAAIPKLGWIAGESDILIRVSGTQKNPEVEGTVKFKDGSMRPQWMVHPLHSLKGEVILRESGLISCKSLSGRCNGRGFSMRGGLFLSKGFEDRLEGKVHELREVVSLSNSGRRRRSRALSAPLEEAVSSLRQGRGGIRIEAGGIPVNVENICSGNVSGKLLLTGNAMKPELDGSLLFSEGIISANSALTDVSKGIRAKSSRPSLNTTSIPSDTKKAQVALMPFPAKLERTKNKKGFVQEGHAKQRFSLHLKQLKVSLGRNVRVTHSFLFNVLVAGNASFSGLPTNPNMTGKINILSGNVSALPARWAIRKSEDSFFSFAHNADDAEDDQEPTIKLVLESDQIILRISECAASSWTENLSLSDKAGNRVSERWWADAIHASDDDRRGNRRRIVNLLTSLMINTLVVGGEIGKYDWKIFPTYFGDALPKFSRSLVDKYGAGFQLDQGNFCLESNIFVDKSKGGQIMVKLAKAFSLHIFGDQSRRFAKFELTLPGKR